VGGCERVAEAVAAGHSRAEVGWTDPPPPPQNFSLPSLRKPQDEQVEAKDSPHSPQKRRPSRFSARQRGHCMRDLPGSYAGNGRTGAASLVWRSEGVKEGEWGKSPSTPSSGDRPVPGLAPRDVIFPFSDTAPQSRCHRPVGSGPARTHRLDISLSIRRSSRGISTSRPMAAACSRYSFARLGSLRTL